MRVYVGVPFTYRVSCILPAQLTPHSDHIPLHRLWDFKNGRVKLDFPEYVHMIDCEECRAGFRACIRANSLAEAEANVNPKEPN